MTTIAEAHAKENQLKIKLEILADQAGFKKEELAEMFEQHEKAQAKQKELKKTIAGYKENEKYVIAGRAILSDLKFQIRSLAVQTGESASEADDKFLSSQLHHCGPQEIDYLRGLKRRLQQKRSGMFLLESITPDEPIDCNRDREKERALGRKIGKTISTH